MNALLLTPDQHNAIIIANATSETRKLNPRQLADGRLILNADILTDAFFATGAWSETLAALEPITLSESDLVESEI